jgi:hypothetical protein
VTGRVLSQAKPDWRGFEAPQDPSDLRSSGFDYPRTGCSVRCQYCRVLGESFAWSPVGGVVVWWYGSARALQGHRCGGMAQRELCMVTGVVVWWYGSASAQRGLCKVTDVVVWRSESFVWSLVWW